MSKQIYDQSWHDTYSAQTMESARRILPDILSLKHVDSICEFGCGHGHWLATALEQGATTILGMDGNWTDRAKLLFPADDFRAVDLGQRIDLDRRYDLAISLEVGEHLPASCARTFVANMARSSSLILFGAAIPLQGGYRHINEQYPSYWADLFDQQGFSAFDLVRPKHWIDKSIHYYYRQNILVYAERANGELIARCHATMEQLTRARPLDLVHPEKYDLMVSYDAIVLRRLLPKLPMSIIRQLIRRLTSPRN